MLCYCIGGCVRLLNFQTVVYSLTWLCPSPGPISLAKKLWLNVLFVVS